MLDLPIDLRSDRRPLRRPSSFAWEPEGGIQPGKGIGASASRFRLTDIDRVRYVDKLAAGTGASDASPRATIWQELNEANIVGHRTRIYVLERDGHYALEVGGYGIPFVGDCELIAVKSFATLAPGNIRHPMAPTLAWADAGDGAWSATLSPAFTPMSVIDEHAVDAYGGGAWLTPVADLNAVKALAGSWAISGATVYVRTSDTRQPDVDIMVMRDTTSNLSTEGLPGTSIYVQGFAALGGAYALSTPNAGQVALIGCDFRYGKLGGAQILGTARSTAIDCRATGNGGDGFAYTTTARALEVGVNASKNGNPIIPTNSENGSSMHGGSIVRVDCEALDNQGPNFGDVLGSTSWMVRCRASGSIATQATQRVGVWIQGTAWLDGCDVPGNLELDLKTQDADSVINVYGTHYETAGGLGTVRASRG